MRARWADGYAAALPYIPTYMPAQAPAEIALIAAVAGVQQDLPREGLTLLDLGCGRGATVLALAAANPSWTVIGLDAMPAHIADARAFAGEAGLDNARFIEADLRTIDEDRAERLLPEADVVTLHGVWTWVSDAVRAGIVRLLRARLRAGGFLHMTYNAMPHWSSDIALSRLLREIMATTHGPADARMDQALALAQSLRTAEARALRKSVFVDRAHKVPEPARPAFLRYAVHEYCSDHWRPAWPQDVAAELAEAKLDFVGSATLGRHFPDLMLDPAQREALARLPPGLNAEFARDLFVPPALRQDIFVRGDRPAPVGPAVAAVTLALRRLPQDGQVRWLIPGRVAELPEAETQAVLGALAEAPRSIGALASLPELAGTTPGELLTVLAGSGVAAPVWRTAPDPGAEARAERYNRVLLQRLGAEAMAAGGDLPAASPMLGAGLPLKTIELATLLVLRRARAEGHPMPGPAQAARWILASDQGEAQLAAATPLVEAAMAERIPAWRALGML